MKKILLLLAALIAMASVSQAQQSVVIAIIHHNIHSGGQAQDAANHIGNLLDMNPQKGLLLCNEANNARQYFDLNYAGWDVFWPGTPFEGRGNPIFTRLAAATMLDSWRLNMVERWTYNDNDRDPRVYTVVKCQMVNDPWIQFHCVNVHFPPNAINAVARQESVDRLIELSQSLPDLPFIICGDFNMSETKVKNQIANPIGGTVYSNANVDHIVVRDGPQVGFGNVEAVRLGKFISDHQALRYNITVKQLTSNVSDWTIY